MATWLEDVIKGLQNLNGVASLSDIYKEVRALRTEPHPNSFDAIIRRTIETYSSDSEAFNGKENIFYSADGLGSGVWGLHCKRSTITLLSIKTETHQNNVFSNPPEGTPPCGTPPSNNIGLTTSPPQNKANKPCPPMPRNIIFA